MRLSPRREHLRRATRADHDRVDALLGGLDLTDRTDYLAFLTGHARAVPPLEAALEAGGAGGLLPDWPERRRTEALRADLRALGGPEPAPAAGAPRFLEAAAALGGLYVLEGSRLGARVLLRRAEDGGDARERNALAYLRHGEERRFWPAFLEVLETHPAGRDLNGLAEGARSAFRWFEATALPVAA